MPSKYYSTASPDGPWDYIVIGSGMGGMTAAALMSRFGRRVLVLEQHYVPGGMTHTFKRKRWRWDVGVHAIGEVSEKARVGRFLKTLTNGQLKWQTLGPVYDEFNFPGDYSIGFPDSKDGFRELLKDRFPAEAAAVDDYFVALSDATRAMRGFFLSRALPNWLGRVSGPLLTKQAERVLATRTADVIHGITDNPKLRTILTAQWGYIGSPPSQSSFAAHALVAKHFLYGGYYPVGGSQQIATAMLAPVIDAGGAVRINADVEQLLVHNNKAIGVRLKGGEEIRCRRVISAIGAPNTARIVPSDVGPPPWHQEVKQLRSSPAHVCLYLGFKGDIRQAGAGSANRWFYETWDHETTEWDFRKSDAEAPVLYTSFPSLKDPLHDAGPQQLHTGEVVTFLPFDGFARWDGTRWQKRGEEYDDLKAELSQRLLDQLLKYMPALKPMIAHAELSTPLSTMHFARANAGGLYGLEATPARFASPWLRPATPLKNLYLAGCDVGMAGVIGAMVGGVLAAMAAEPRKVLPFIARI